MLFKLFELQPYDKKLIMQSDPVRIDPKNKLFTFPLTQFTTEELQDGQAGDKDIEIEFGMLTTDIKRKGRGYIYSIIGHTSLKLVELKYPRPLQFQIVKPKKPNKV